MTTELNMPVFVIGLERLKTERYQRVLNDLARIGVDATVWPAVDGTLPIEREPGEAVKRFKLECYAIRGQGLLQTEIACYLSHYRLLKHALERNYARIIVLEDDAVVDAARFKEALEHIAKLDQAFEYIKLEKEYFNRNKVRGAVKGPALAKDGSCALYAPGDWKITGAFGYSISRRGLQKLTPALMPIGTIIDRVTLYNRRKTGLRIWTTAPPLVKVDLAVASSIREAESGARARYRALVKFALAPLRWAYQARIITDWEGSQGNAAPSRRAYAQTIFRVAFKGIKRSALGRAIYRAWKAAKRYARRG